jgi:branched-chain amino acid transport system ATP-binding protein
MHGAFVKIHSRGTSILLVEQNVGLALDVATRGYVLESGRIALEGTAEELNANPAVRAAYLGM